MGITRNKPTIGWVSGLGRGIFHSGRFWISLKLTSPIAMSRNENKYLSHGFGKGILKDVLNDLDENK